MGVRKLIPLMLVILTSTAGAADAAQLIVDLNTSPDLNQQARKTLRGQGTDALAVLLPEVERYRSLTDEACLHATRALRALREIDTAQAVPAGIAILAAVPGDTATQTMLLNETLDYLTGHFQDQQARDAYYGLLKNQTSKWLTPEGDFVMLFILNGIAPMHQNHDPRVDEMLTLLLGKLPYAPPSAPGNAGGRWSCTQWLGPDGYTPQRCKAIMATYKTRTQMGPSCFYDPYYRERMLDEQGRYRIACLKLARDYGTKGLIATITPLLQSRQRSERDLALDVIETLNKQAETIAEIDILRLKNGDIISGTIENTAFVITTDYARISLQRQSIKTIRMDGPRAVVELLAGDRLSGTIEDTLVRLRLKNGSEISIDLHTVADLTCAH